MNISTGFRGFARPGAGSQTAMGAGAVFVLLVVIVVLALIGGAFYAVRAGLWAKETKPSGDTAEGGRERGGRPEHTQVDEPGRQTYLGT